MKNSFLFETKIRGLSALIGDVFIAFKQLLPEELISSLPFLHIRVNHLLFTAFALCLSMTLLKISGGKVNIVMLIRVCIIGGLYMKNSEQ